MASTMGEGGTLEIPLKDSADEVIELDLEALPTGEEALGILRQESAPLHLWIRLAIQYHRQGQTADFVRLLEVSGSDASLEYPSYEKDQMRALDTLAAHYVNSAHRERSKDKRRELFNKATLLYTTADKIDMYDQNHLLGRAYFCLLEGDKLEQADAQFTFVINQSPNSIPALLGKACIAAQKKDYKTALFFYKKALRFNLRCPAEVRVGMAHCLLRLGKREKAEAGLERALALAPNCVPALVAQAVLSLNEHQPQAIRYGVQLLSHAYSLDSGNPMVLNHLANHFFFKKDYAKAHHLALYAFHSTENEAMRAESCYQMARAFHAQEEWDKAFQYYYQASQFASPHFVLPFFGLALMHIYRGDFHQAAECLEKVLKAEPNSLETVKILASLYANPEAQKSVSESVRRERRLKAKALLQRYVEEYPEDPEAWIELAQLLEETELEGALKAYQTVSALLSDDDAAPEVPVEILNNMASLHYRLGRLDQARSLLREALGRVEGEEGGGEDFSRADSLTLRYNLARVLEASSEYDEAEKLYKGILRERAKYIDCYLRLGCMARDRGQIFEASVIFKEALSVHQASVDAWSLIGNLHVGKAEWGPAQKKFEKILTLAEAKEDPYSLVGLGNIWLQTLFGSGRDRSRDKRHGDRALAMFTKALKVGPRNMWAANGVGCVLAQRGLLAEARDVFAQVREATADFPDVWLNIAHIYLAQGQYQAAVQMYENCLAKFYPHYNLDVLLYLARAYFKAGQLDAAKRTLMKARRVGPWDGVVTFNLGVVLGKMGTKALAEPKSGLETVMGAVAEVKLGERYLGAVRAREVEPALAAAEARRCGDVLSQAAYHVSRARQQDQAEREQRRRQEDERAALRQLQQEAQSKRQETLQLQLKELEAKRQDFLTRTKEILVMPQVQDEEKVKKSSSSSAKPGRSKEFVNDSSDLGEYVMGPDGEQRRVKKKGRAEKRRQREERRGEAGASSDSDSSQGPSKPRRPTSPKLSAQQRAKVKSKEFVETSSDSEDGAKGGRSPRARPPTEDSDSDAAPAGASPAAPADSPTKRRVVASDSSDDDGPPPAKRPASAASSVGQSPAQSPNAQPTKARIDSSDSD